MKLSIQVAVAAVAALGLWVAAAVEPGPVRAQAAGSISGEAYGTYVQMIGASLAKTPYAVLSAGNPLVDAQTPSVSVPGVAQAQNLVAMTAGAGDTHDASAQSGSTLESVNLLNGVVRADLVMAIASSAIHGTVVNSNADGSTFSGLIVNGVSIAPDVAPNTSINVPLVGTVVLNEQIRLGDGVNSTGLRVNMIHVRVKDALTGLTTGEIIVGSARSYVAR